MPSTAAQDEFDALINGTGRRSPSRPHPADSHSRSRSHSSSSSHNGEKSSRDLEKRALRPSARNHRDSDYEDEASDFESRATGLGPRKSGKMRYYIPKTRSEANTGPKGVIADAQAFEQARRAHRSVTSLAQQQAPERYTSASRGQSDKPSRPLQQHARTGSWLAEADEEDESDDDDFMTRWRQTRLQELNRQRGVHGYIGRRSPSAPRYGSLVGVDAEGYLDAVEQTKSDTIVCVLIYDDLSEVSRLIEHATSSVARANPNVRFIKLHYEEAQMDPMGVPAMLAYRGGDKFADMVPIIDEIPLEDELSGETLGIAMRRCGLLP